MRTGGRIIYLIVILSYILSACDGSSEETNAFASLNYTLISFSKTDSTCSEKPCTNVRIEYPVFNGPDSLTRNPNKEIRGIVAETLGQKEAEEPDQIHDISRLSENFIKGYIKFKNEFQSSVQIWEVDVSTREVFMNDTLISVHLMIYVYTGGAHPTERMRIFNFDQRSGKTINNKKIIGVFPKIQRKAEEKFRAVREISKTGSLAEKGFLFPEEIFLLPSNIGYSQNGLVLYYNPYEVAPYAMGPTALMILYEELNP